MNKKIIKQLVKEFWIQFIISILWAVWKINGELEISEITINFIANFGACFFLTSWFFGQILRVKKQQLVESHLDSLTNNLQKLITNLELASQKIIDNVTGGKSFIYMIVGNINESNDTGHAMFIHSGDNPVYDASVQIVDINNMMQNGDYHRQGLTIGTLPPKTGFTGPVIKLDRIKGVHYSVFFTTRRGLINQSIRLKFKDGKWYSAIHVSDFDGLQFFEIPQDYPIDENDKDIIQWKEWQIKYASA